jgi:hypothetical protein
VALALAGAAGLITTAVRNLRYAMHASVAPIPGGAARARAVIAWLHFIQPLARFTGQLRARLWLSPPDTGPHRVQRAGARITRADGAFALRLISGRMIEDRFWAEHPVDTAAVLSDLTDALRSSRMVRTIDIDEGWTHTRDISVLVSRLLWIDLRTLVEHHERGRSLLRLATHVRPTALGAAALVAAAGGLLTGIAAHWIGLAAAGVVLLWMGGRVLFAGSAIRRIAADRFGQLGLTRLEGPPS